MSVSDSSDNSEMSRIVKKEQKMVALCTLRET
jgi:hypothetical protein